MAPFVVKVVEEHPNPCTNSCLDLLVMLKMKILLYLFTYNIQSLRQVNTFYCPLIIYNLIYFDIPAFSNDLSHNVANVYPAALDRYVCFEGLHDGGSLVAEPLPELDAFCYYN